MSSATTTAAMERLQSVLDAPVPSRAPTQEHLLLKAAIVTADRGSFEAVISSEAVDREKDIVRADAMVAALQAWTTSAKLIPLLWSHSSKAEDVIGHIDPASAEAVNGEVHAAGWIDQGTERGEQAWRIIKSRTAGFSFGYLVDDAVKRDDGIREITALDVFEVSLCATPMNGMTRVTAWKSADREPLSLDELHRLEASLGLGEPAKLQKIHNEARDTLLAAMGGTNGDRSKALRDRADRAAREHGPVVISSFDA